MTAENQPLFPEPMLPEPGGTEAEIDELESGLGVTLPTLTGGLAFSR